MLKRFFSCLLIFFAMITIMQIAQAEGASFSERTAGMNAIKDVRYSAKSGRIRIVLDMTKKLTPRDYSVEYYENPSRMVIDFKNSWITEQIPKELKIESFAASRIRIAQFNPQQVRMVIDTMAENYFFVLSGGPAGNRFIVDIGAGAESSKAAFSKSVSGELQSVKVDTVESEPDNKIDIINNSSDENDNKSDKDKNKDKNKSKKKEKKEKKEKNDTKDDDIDKRLENITGVRGKKIVIDPGHGGNDSGAIGPSGVMEKTVTLRVSLVLRELLENEGAIVLMTRETDKEVAEKGKYATDVEELKSRCDLANDNDADIFVSIHADSFSKPTARGTTGYYFGKATNDSQKLADCIRKALIAQIKTPSRGTQPCNFYVVRNSEMPATLVELAFISNPEEERLLNSDEGVLKAAQGIFDGIEDYFG